MVADRTPDGGNDPTDVELEAAVEAVVDDEEESESDDERHYLQDPDNLAVNARDIDEREQDDVLELDQTELDESGLTLGDPHQPEPE